MSDASYHLSLKEIKGDNQSLKKGEIIARNTNFLTFVFEDVDFHSFENVHYQYRIIRNDVSQDWSSIRKSTDVTIDYPEPGRYRIDFRRMDARNMITPLQISHSFYISPNFYETGWFLFLALMGLVLLIALSLWTYMERKQRLLQQEVDVKNTITELQLSSIQSQMNPHFMFNAMNVLIHMINLAPKRKAEEFAVSFASLMRKVLDQSRKSFISIEDEISTLQDYLFIQKQRLGPNFEYEIHCPVYIYKIQIPTMIIQPFVENAIIHGVSQVDWPGRISIIFSGNATNWQVEITDNGKGINNKNFKIKNVAKKSFGISLVQKKLELIKNRYDISIDMVISEKDPDEGLGTRVTLQRLPQ
jgi:LytS/YehU family sensor histidine kinase